METIATPRDLISEAFRRIVVHASDVADGPEITDIKTAARHPGVVMIRANGYPLDVWFSMDGEYLTARVGRQNTVSTNDRSASFPVTTGMRECGEAVSRAIAAFIA